MTEVEEPLRISQFHVMLRGINPPVWRRLLLHSNSTIADLHHILQIAFHWSDFHLHRFLIRGIEYGISRTGCVGFTTNPQKVTLADFNFRIKERFLYEYDFSDLWQHQVRFERAHSVVNGRTYPVCVGGARAAPPEDCGGPEAYMKLMDHHRLNLPYEELLLIADALGGLLDAKEDQNIRACLGNLDELQAAVDSLAAYNRFQPHHFDRRKANQGLKQYAAGDEAWMWQ